MPTWPVQEAGATCEGTVPSRRDNLRSRRESAAPAERDGIPTFRRIDPVLVGQKESLPLCSPEAGISEKGMQSRKHPVRRKAPPTGGSGPLVSDPCHLPSTPCWVKQPDLPIMQLHQKISGISRTAQGQRTVYPCVASRPQPVSETGPVGTYTHHPPDLTSDARCLPLSGPASGLSGRTPAAGAPPRYCGIPPGPARDHTVPCDRCSCQSACGSPCAGP